VSKRRPRSFARGTAETLITVPNMLSLLRLAGVPLFLWLLLGLHHDLLAVLVLALSGLTDWLDGKLARLLDQSSRLGALLDPAVDRLYTLSALLAFGVRGILPWWVIAVLIGRDLVLASTLPVLHRYGYGPLPVHYMGKAATLCLLYAFPLLLLAHNVHGWAGALAQAFAVAFTGWGIALYLWSGVLYLVQMRLTVRAARVQTRDDGDVEECAVIPEDLRYTPEHEWVRLSATGTVRVGITDYAQARLGDVVYIKLPHLGEAVVVGEPIGEVESTKSVSDVFAPVAGEVVARNDTLEDSPELVNSDPYGEGWMMEIKMADTSEVDSLMIAQEYRTLIGEG
jgi:cardiolipin synthase (CMP-forming)